jgi:DNA adenine methylase
MSVSGGPGGVAGFRTRNTGISCANDLINHSLKEISQRLKTVQILNDDAVTMIDRYQKYDDFLIYFDPPYIKETRSQKQGYANFEVEDSFHIEMAEKLIKLSGMVVVSGYQCDLYDELYKDFKRVDMVSQTNAGGSKTESLWLSPLVQERLSGMQQQSLF